MTSFFSPFLNPEKCVPQRSFFQFHKTGDQENALAPQYRLGTQSGEETRPRQDGRKLGEGRENFPRRRLCRGRGKTREVGKCTSGVSQTHSLWACGKVREEGGGRREGEERLPRARSQELPPQLLSEDRESWSFLLYFFPSGGHFSRFNRDKEGALGRASISRSCRLAHSGPRFGPWTGRENWPSGTLKLLRGGGGVTKLLSNHGGSSMICIYYANIDLPLSSLPHGGLGRARAERR